MSALSCYHYDEWFVVVFKQKSFLLTTFYLHPVYLVHFPIRRELQRVQNSINKHKDLRRTFPFIHTLKVKQVKKKKEAVTDSHTVLLLPFSESVMLKVKNSNRRTIQV